MTLEVRKFGVMVLGLLSLSSLPALTPTESETQMASLTEDVQYIQQVFGAGHAALQAQINVHKPIMASNFATTRQFISETQSAATTWINDESIDTLQFPEVLAMVDVPELPNFYDVLSSAKINAPTTRLEPIGSFYTEAEQIELRALEIHYLVFKKKMAGSENPATRNNYLGESGPHN